MSRSVSTIILRGMTSTGGCRSLMSSALLIEFHNSKGEECSTPSDDHADISGMYLEGDLFTQVVRVGT